MANLNLVLVGAPQAHLRLKAHLSRGPDPYNTRVLTTFGGCSRSISGWFRNKFVANRRIYEKEAPSPDPVMKSDAKNSWMHATGRLRKS